MESQVDSVTSTLVNLSRLKMTCEKELEIFFDFVEEKTYSLGAAMAENIQNASKKDGQVQGKIQVELLEIEQETKRINCAMQDLQHSF